MFSRRPDFSPFTADVFDQGAMATRPNPADPALASSLLELSPHAVLVLDSNGSRVQFANAAATRLLAAAPGTVVQHRPLGELVPPRLAEAIRSAAGRAIAAGAPESFEVAGPDATRWYAATVTPAPDGVAVFLADITEAHAQAVAGVQATMRTDAIIDGAPQLVIALDVDLNVLALNRSYASEFQRVFGRSIAVGDNLRTALDGHPEARAEAVRRWERAVRGEEFTLHRELGADGKEARIYEIRYGALRDREGRNFGAVSLMNDVTDLIRDRAALAELTERLDAVIRYSPDRVVGVDKELRVVAMNEHAKADFASLWGVPIAVGDSLAERLSTLPTEQRTAALDMWTRAVQGTAATQFAIFGTTPETLQAYEISFGALRDSAGNPAGAVMVAKDVTDREVALTALRESEARFRALGEAAPIGIFLTDAAGNCTYANPRLQQLWELREATLLTQGFMSRVHDDDSAEARAWLGQSGGGDYRGEFRIVMADGLQRWVLAHSAAIRDESGTIVGRVGTIDDVTEARLAGEASRQLEQKMLHAQKLESLEVLAGGIAHDFNNLLVGVLGNASLALLDLPRDSPAYGPVADIERAAQRASDLTRQMLAYSGRGQFVVEPVDLSDLVAEMGSLLRTVLSKQAVIEFALEPMLPLVEADATQLRQVVMNLITNASDALGDDGGRIRVATGRQVVEPGTVQHTYLGEAMEPGDYAFVEVQDTGVGMSADTLARIFEPFFTTKFTGRGLGLAATLGIVRGHHGGITITTAPGQGATFRVLLPTSDAARPGGRTERRDPGGAAATGGAILVIDDDETVRVVARRLLERRGFRVVVAEDGVEGIERFADSGESFSLVLLDLTMPRLGGASTMAELRKRDPQVRVLLTSGYREREVAAHFVGMEPVGFVQKPFRAEELYTAVTRALRVPVAGG
ncbi:MAG: PAS domain-containing protein [Gemmatimonadaceae bacterium]|nr:PAS domain-containing protein [Gemmatimonadaceae bacterium]